jgi:hypothetical protein
LQKTGRRERARERARERERERARRGDIYHPPPRRLWLCKASVRL